MAVPCASSCRRNELYLHLTGTSEDGSVCICDGIQAFLIPAVRKSLLGMAWCRAIHLFQLETFQKSYIENVFWNVEFRAFCLWGMAAVSLKLWAPLFKLWSLSRGCAALLSQMPGLEPQSFGAFSLGGIETPMFSEVVSVEIFHKKTCPNGISTLVRPDELWKQLSAFQCCSVQAWAHPCSRSINELCVPGALMP